jgi:hypothetical protein
MKGDEVQIAGAGIGFINLRQILPEIWLDQVRRLRQAGPSTTDFTSIQIRGYIRGKRMF